MPHSAFRHLSGGLRGTLAPSGTVLILGGRNSGTDPDVGAYSLTVDMFYMDKYEVTKTLWDEVKNWNSGNGYIYESMGSGKATNHPVHTVNWYDVVKWCNARSEKAGLTPAYYTDAGYTSVFQTGTVSGVDSPYVNGSADGYRLPTGTEWEYAARGGVASKRFPWGDTINNSNANYRAVGNYPYDDSNGASYHPTYNDSTKPYTSPVGDFAANGYGLYDMVGNVLEWCYDWSPTLSSSHRVGCGGAWLASPLYCRVASRASNTPDKAIDFIGFRAVLPARQ
jgi:formylglycine-generating enzyme required for sulfatase activity